MGPSVAIAPPLLARARADQVATLYAHGHLTTLSMGLGACILCAAMWTQVQLSTMLTWFTLIALNQAWRTALLRAFQRQRAGAIIGPWVRPSPAHCGAWPR